MNVWKDMADGFVLFTAFKIMATCWDIIGQPAAWFGASAFLAGAAVVGALMFTDYYLRETI